MLKGLPRDKKILYALAIALILLITPLFFINKSISRYVIAVLLVLSAVTVSMLLKKRNILSINKKTVTLLLFVVAVLSIAIYYLSGIYFGFFRNPYVLTFWSGVSRCATVSASIIAIEFIRRVFLSYDGKAPICVMFLAGVIVDVIISPDVIIFSDFSAFMRLFGLTVLPSLAANVLYNYVSKRYGIFAVLAYRLPIALYRYVASNISGVVDVLYSFVKITVPILTLLFIDMLFGKKNKRVRLRRRAIGHVLTGFLALLMISVVMLISGRFKYTLLVIGSESMTGEIDKGDAIVYESYDGDIIKNGDVIVYRKEGILVIHRVVGIERINGQTRYYTKGDANEENDRGYITDSDVVGRVSLKLPGVGYPTILLRKIFSD